MGRTIYSRCVELCGGLEKGMEISLEKLRRNIMVKIGGQERTIQSALNVMTETNLIREVGYCRFKIL